MSRIAVFTFAFALFACGSEASQFQNSAAVPASPNAPTTGVGLVALRNDDGTIVRSCAVTLVDETHAVTARACTDGVDPTSLSVTFADTTSNDGWIPVTDGSPLDSAVVSLTLANDAGVAPMSVNNDALTDDLDGTTGRLVAYGSTGDSDYRNSAAGVLTAFDDTTLTVRNSGSSADQGGPFLLHSNGQDLVVGIAGTTTDGTTFTFLRADVLSLSE